jgi:lysophospholipase L1-like esterase
MFSSKMKVFGRPGLAGAAVVLVIGLAPAYSDMPGAAPAVLAAKPTAAGIAAATPTAPAAPLKSTPAPDKPIACAGPAELAHLDFPLHRTAGRLASGVPVKVVAIGSSSTAGAGASSPAASYPSRLEVELHQHFPGRAFNVLNRGVNGEVVADMVARFETSVVPERPDLVLWQVGTNSVLRDHPIKPHLTLLHDGVERLKALGTDIVLIDPQFAPKVLAKRDAQGMVELIARIAKQENVDLFHRFAVMRHWREVQNVAFDRFLSADELHMNDWSYACVAKLLGVAIAEAATRPVAAAAAQPRR